KGEIARVDARSGRITARIAVAPGTSYLAFGQGKLWAVSGPQAVLQRVDPARNAVAATTGLGRQPGFLAVGEGAVWVQEQGDGSVARIDPATALVTGRVKVGASLAYGDIDTGAGRVWLRTTADQTWVAIDARSLAIVARTGAAEGSGALRYTRAGLWTSAHDRQTLSFWALPPRHNDH
ncbi:MAG: YncE family protein, partial [Sphingomonadales bacterium]